MSESSLPRRYRSDEPARLWKISPDRVLNLDRVYTMGILNATPDSFSDGGLFNTAEKAAEQAARLAESGADIIDIGCQSTRPGFSAVLPDEELERLKTVLGAITAALPDGFPLSADTFCPSVARYALEHGVSIVNDVTGLRDPTMMKLVAEYGCGAVVMHDEDVTSCADPAAEISSFFERRVCECLEYGIAPEQLVLDCGIGFGKTREQELWLLHHMDACRVRNLPLLAAASRKRVVRQYYMTNAADIDSATFAAHCDAVRSGAQLVRVHAV